MNSDSAGEGLDDLHRSGVERLVMSAPVDVPPAHGSQVRRRSFLKLAALAASASAVAPGLEALMQPSCPVTLSKSAVRCRNIYLNQVGYLPQDSKVATVVLEPLPARIPNGSGAPSSSPVPEPAWRFEVLSEDSSDVVFSGALSDPYFDATSGDQVCLADLTGLRSGGRYRVAALGHTGDLFEVGANVYAEPLRLAMRAYYGQRCGCPVDLGDGYKHGICHQDGIFGASSGRAGDLNNSGGWHDAGDYGRYIVNSGVTCGTLLLAWEMYPEALQSLNLGLPESGGRLPDFLAEVKWNLDWMLTMQDTVAGGAWQKQTSACFCAFMMPEQDHLPSEVIGTGSAPYTSTCATADFAGVMAIAARCYKPYDQEFSARCLAAARRAFAWSKAHPAVLFKNPKGITTGEYGDSHTADELLWASAELFHTTREQDFEQYFLSAVQPLLGIDQGQELKVASPSWNNLTSLGLWSYTFAQGSAADENQTRATIQRATLAAANQLIERSSKHAYGNTLVERDFHWGSNSDAANQSLLILVADRFQPSPELFQAALGNLHYLLGRNCFGVSWVTHVGVRPFLHPHHRPSVADGIMAPWPGLLSGGPNAHGGDITANRVPMAAPMRMWLDDDRAYSMNEVAINWNAPLVFLLAAANVPRHV